MLAVDALCARPVLQLFHSSTFLAALVVKAASPISGYYGTGYGFVYVYIKLP